MLKSCGLVGSSGQVVQGDIKKACELKCGQNIRDGSVLLIPAVGGIGNFNLSGGIFLIEACLFAACSKVGGKICLHGCFSFFAGMFRRCGGEVLSARAESTQRAARGWGQSNFGGPPPHSPCAPPLDPVYGGPIRQPRRQTQRRGRSID